MWRYLSIQILGKADLCSFKEICDIRRFSPHSPMNGCRMYNKHTNPEKQPNPPVY